MDFRYSGRVIGREEFSDAAGRRFKDCWKVETRLTFMAKGATLLERVSEIWLASGLGNVETRQTDGAGKPVRRAALLGGPGGIYESLKLPAPTAMAAPNESPIVAEDWKLSRFASRRVATGAAEHTTARRGHPPARR
jgi:hypothetical protein